MSDPTINLIINSESFKNWLNDKPPHIRDNWEKYKMMTVEKYIKDMKNENRNRNRENRNREDINKLKIQDKNYTDSNDNVIVNTIGPYTELQANDKKRGGKRKRKTLKRKRSKKTKNNKKSRKSKRKMTKRRR